MNQNPVPAGSPSCPPSAGASDWPPAVRETPAKKPFACDKIDFLFVFVFWALSYYYIWMSEQVFGYVRFWGTPHIALFTAAYAACVLGYLYLKKQKPAAESWFWLAVMLALGVPVSLWSLAPFVQIVLLHLAALYWTLCAFGALMDGKTGNLLVYDCMSAFAVVPFGNWLAPFRAMRWTNSAKGAWRRKVLMAALGLAIAVPLLCVVLPLLSSADQNFQSMLDHAFRWVVRGSVIDALIRLVLAVPVTCVLYGLCYGAAHRSCTDWTTREGIEKGADSMRFLPDAAVAVALGVMCAVYALFTALQGGYLFSGFFGHLPASFSYAEYARQGFFELCRIGAINVCLLAGANLLSKTPRLKNKRLRLLNLALSALSLLLVATALSKMGLYIAAYGLTAKRVLATTLLVWLALVFLGVIAWQFKRFDLVRFAVFAGAVLVCLLCVLNVGGLIDAYNFSHFGIPSGQPQVLLDGTEWLLQ